MHVKVFQVQIQQEQIVDRFLHRWRKTAKWKLINVRDHKEKEEKLKHKPLIYYISCLLKFNIFILE